MATVQQKTIRRFKVVVITTVVVFMHLYLTSSSQLLGSDDELRVITITTVQQTTAKEEETTGIIKASDYPNSTNYAFYNYTQVYNTVLTRSTHTTSDGVAPQYFKAVPCRIDWKPEHAFLLRHFAHTMQALYPCVDIWYDEHSKKSMYLPPVLLVNDSGTVECIVDGLRSNEFVRGVAKMLEIELGNKPLIMTVDEYKHSDVYYHPNQTVHSFHPKKMGQGYVLPNPRIWNELAMQLTTSNNNISKQLDGALAAPTVHHQQEEDHSVTSTVGNEKRFKHECIPRVGILNRRSRRSILNAEELANLVPSLLVARHSSLTGMNAEDSGIKNYTGLRPHVQYFEGTTFHQQVDFFQQTDILVSPHGAQLTGLPFMHKPGGCSQMLEVFPHTHKFMIPKYFGTLAVQSGISHSYIGVSDKKVNEVVGEATPVRRPMPWEWRMAATNEERTKNRDRNMRPSMDDMRDALTELIDDWRRCCQQHEQQQQQARR